MLTESYYIGIDIGGTHTKMGLIGEQEGLIRKSKFESYAFKEPEAYLDRLVKDMNKLVSSVIPFSEISGIGIGAPTADYYSGKIQAPVNMDWHQPLDIKSYLEMLLGTHVAVTNDANLAALGELHFGWGATFSNLLVVTLGTGLGAGIIIDNQLVHGVDDLAGEIGHLTLFPNGRTCSCGKRGCLEAYVSIRGLMETFQEIDRSHQALSPYQIYEEANDANENALKAIELTGEFLGLGLANAATTLAPECIVLSGGLAGMGQKLLGPTLQSFEKNLVANLRGKIKLTISDLKDNDLSLMGASVLVKNTLSNQNHVKQ